ncbi:hypothetical protein PVBG_05701 [Plasmodium vivax Brazil I]|uniref:Uncharacterized protein n=1 Tax=Plasmodium vivax (strain Brazil I) TaxID=1033975 RepID=A0A0J9T0Z4_PLAV1|nr:hypothetical protein PVBG_05701 [Plasmodium vivax Brazil I]
MEISRATKMKNKSNLYFFNKIVIFIILTWVHKCQNDEENCYYRILNNNIFRIYNFYRFSFEFINELIRTLENGKSVNISLDIRTHRLLAKHEYQNEKTTTGLQYNASYNRDNYKLEKGKGKNNTFQQLKENRTNHVDDYLKCYRNRYSKKSGLKKLDCYYENKVFNKFRHMCGIAQKIKNDKRCSKYFFFKRYAIVLFLLSLLPFIGLIHPMLFGLNHKYPGILGACEESHIETSSYAHKPGLDESDGIKNCSKR